MEAIKGKTVCITGATAGIGKAIAEAFAREGARLIITGRRTERLSEISKALTAEHGAEVLPITLDVRDKEAVVKAFAGLSGEWKHIDILVNNAGLARGFDFVHEGNLEDWDEMIDTNVKGLLYVTRQVLPQMTERKSGHIINLGSTAGREVYPRGNVYSATKYAVKALTWAMRLENIDKNIKVSTVDPGMVETEFSNVRFSGDTEKAKKVYEGVTPLTAVDVAETVIFCATRPKHVNINEVVLSCVQQASSNFIHRER